MKKITFFFFILLTTAVQAEIKQLPDQTLTSTAIGTLHSVDSFLVSASRGGVSLFVYDDSLQQYRFLTRNYISALDSVTTKLVDSILIINSHDEKLHFVFLKNLPELQYLGVVDLNRPFADYTLIGNSLYIAGFYDGILRYSLQDYSTVKFVDSSMTGILVTQLSHDSEYLYALDEYNGLLRYDITGNGFGIFDDYLFVPFRANAFTKIDSLFYLHLIRGGLLVGDFNQPSGNNIIDSILDLSQVANLYNNDSLFIITEDRFLTLINKSNFDDKVVYTISNVNPLGLLNRTDSNLSLLLPTIGGGLTILDIDTMLSIRNGLTYNGKINDIYIYNSLLYISSSAEPIQLYAIDSTGFTTYAFSVYENLKNTGHLINNGDSVFVIYPDIDKLAVIVNADEPDSVLLENSITISSSPAREMSYVPKQLDNNNLIFLDYPFKYQLYAASDSGFLSYVGEWRFVSDMTSFASIDSFVVVTDRKNECTVYQPFSEFRKFIASFSLSGTATESIFYNDLLYLFVENEMYILDFSDRNNISIQAVISIPNEVVDAVIAEDYLFTVGSGGITKFDLKGSVPIVIDAGGLPGNSIVVDYNLIVVHDNQSVMLYYHDLPLTGQNQYTEENNFVSLGQNYPNPFNLETVINYSMSEKSKVQLSIYNILGQKVKTLINTEQDAGNYSVSWDGTSSSGNVIATGIYLYKLETEQAVSKKKMILIK